MKTATQLGTAAQRLWLGLVMVLACGVLPLPGRDQAVPVKISAGPHGSVVSSGEVTVPVETELTLTATPPLGYEIGDRSIHGPALNLVPAVSEHHTREVE